MSEELQFDIKLSSTNWGKQPQFSIWLDEEKIVSDQIESDIHSTKFSRTLSHGSHTIKIRLENKLDQDTQIEQGNIVNDMLLNIVDIEINDISLGKILWDAEYLLDEPHEYNGKQIDHLDHCVNLGWNGSYILKFSTPFYEWLLEKL